MQKQPPALINRRRRSTACWAAPSPTSAPPRSRRWWSSATASGCTASWPTSGALTAAELAAKSGTHERYVREWLNAHAASGYVNYLADSGRYQLSPEQAMLFAQEESPAFIVGGFQTALAAGRIVDRLTEAFKYRRRHRLARAPPRHVSRLRTVLQSGISQSPGAGVDPGARRRRSQTQGRHPRRRRGLRCGLLDADHGQGLSELALHRIRLPRRVDRRRASGMRARPASAT